MQKKLLDSFMEKSVGLPKLAWRSLPFVLSASAHALEPPTAPVTADDTMIFHAHDFKIRENNKISFTLDGTHLGIGGRLRLLGDDIRKTAILWKGTSDGRHCPFLDISKRPYTIEQVKPGQMIFRIDTTVTDAEIKALSQTGCVVSQKPLASRIRWLDNENGN